MAGTDPNSDNPYRSPSAISEPARRRTRWRVAVVTLFMVYGVMGLLGTPVPLMVAYSRPPEYGGGITLLRVIGVSLSAVAAVLWIASGVMCWRGRWLLACLGVVVAILAQLGAGQLVADLGL